MNASAARDEMLTVFKNAWEALSLPISRVVWNDLPGNVPTGEVPWARVTLRHGPGGQSSLAGADGDKMFTATGTIFVQIFAPMSDGQKTALDLAQAVVSAYRQARGSVWYRNARFKEVGASGAFDQINVLADFTYDDTE